MTERSQTGLDAYREIGESGLLNRVSYAVYDCIWNHGAPMTRNEIDAGCSKTGKPNQAFSRRLVEMERRGVLVRKGTKTCPLKETTCTAWDINEGALPVPVAPSPPLKPILSDLAKGGPYFDATGDCIFCEEKSRGPIGHKPTCIWRRAKAVTDP